MKKYWNRLKYWIYVRRFHVSSFSFDEEDGCLHLFVWHNGKRVRVTDGYGLQDGLSITDYGVCKAIERAS